ncbi:hypothetical protein SNOG_20121 [Parastagonospora nodorum SN15]|uniref:Uncharacterized protein n=1 Tax=Phaeosphaeria nodorum (strain SN15 / ATCC MYA-4574 / FGSC 10173) TaxID=321614 RepID=A9JXB7_PHANO|nr:hypothetical protein SNOG_20121 [Parastagonospora nodorum SN15]EDP89807.1 hypothetical protein SNOG_20121 [Parastagonospora nodorum SN15]
MHLQTTVEAIYQMARIVAEPKLHVFRIPLVDTIVCYSPGASLISTPTAVWQGACTHDLNL